MTLRKCTYFSDLKAQQQLILLSLNEIIQGVLAHGQYIMEPEVKELEARLAAYVKVKHAVSFSLETDTVQAAILLAKLEVLPRKVAERCSEALAPFVEVPHVAPECNHGLGPIFGAQRRSWLRSRRDSRPPASPPPFIISNPCTCKTSSPIWDTSRGIYRLASRLRPASSACPCIPI
jgi:hypothetical protein